MISLVCQLCSLFYILISILIFDILYFVQWVLFYLHNVDNGNIEFSSSFCLNDPSSSSSLVDSNNSFHYAARQSEECMGVNCILWEALDCLTANVRETFYEQWFREVQFIRKEQLFHSKHMMIQRRNICCSKMYSFDGGLMTTTFCV